MATTSSTQPAKSKPTPSTVEGNTTVTTVTTSTTNTPTTATANPAPPPRKELAELARAFAAETGKRLEAMQCSQVESWSGGPQQQGSARSKEPREKTQSRTPSTSPIRRYALEMWVKIEVSPRAYTLPEGNFYSVNFVVDTLKEAYPGSTDVHLSKAGHLLAFYRKRGAPNASLTLEQGMEACQILQEIPCWMGNLAHVKVCAISLQAAKELLAGLKQLEWESIRKAHLDLQAQLLAWQLGSILSAMAKPFVPLATSSSTVMGPSAVPCPLPLGDQPTRPIYTTDDEGSTTDASMASQLSVQPGRLGHKRGNHGGKKKTASGNCTDSSTASSSTTASRKARKKKTGVTTKVMIPEVWGQRKPH